MLLAVNALLFLLVIARSAPQNWVDSADIGAGEAARAEGASAREVSARGSALGGWGKGWGEIWGNRSLGNLRKVLALGYGGRGGYAESGAENLGVELSEGEGVGGLYGDLSYGNGGGNGDENGGGNDARPQQEQREHVCWTSSGDYSSPSPPGVTIHGRGCATCIRGQRCSFRLSVRAPAQWAEGVLQTTKRGWWKRDVTVTMRGAAMGAGDVRCLDPPHCREMRVTYRLWDGGEYLATMHIGCANLRFSPLYYLHLNKTAQHDLVSWPLTVLPRTAPNSTAQAQQTRLSLPQQGSSPSQAYPEPDSDLPSSPCIGASVPARWKMRNGLYRWEPFFCTHKELPASRWIAALEQRGIREISIVGDSHQRFLTAHLYYLLTGRADMRMKKWRDNLFYTAEDGEGRELKINFYWIDGIYSNGKFGCSHRGITTRRETQYPNISSTADVTLFEGGYWGASFCKQPLKALRVYLREFVRWGISAVAPGKGRVVFRTIPSFAVRWDSCNRYTGPRTNRAGMAVNALLKRIVLGEPRRGEGRTGGGGRGGRGEGGGEGVAWQDLDESLQMLPREELERGSHVGGNDVLRDSSAEAAQGNLQEVAGGRNLTDSRSTGGTDFYTDSESAEGEAAGTAAGTAAGEEGGDTEIPAGAATILDTWQIDAPRYLDTAVPDDHHYSMVVATDDGDAVVGEVGEAHVRAFIHYLLYTLPPPAKQAG
ncbi:unnamed protein product [Closterium sp. Naga37s-1]|nr:unnamed protein product [Closterium sp. Naga37s-1]